MSTISETCKISSFSDLATLETINQIPDWNTYVEQLNRKNPGLISDNGVIVLKDDSKFSQKAKSFTCYVCYINFMEHTDKFGNKSPFSVGFRYKPHKSNWRSESVCTACFYALQNPNFSYFSKTIYGYPGILTLYKSGHGWFYKDTRDLSDWDDEFQNPE